jgi:hypothetical protein
MRACPVIGPYSMRVVERSIMNEFVILGGMNECASKIIGKSHVPFLRGKDGAFIVREPNPRGSVHSMAVVPSPEQVAILALALQIWILNLALVASRGMVSGTQRMKGRVVVVVVVVVVWPAGQLCRGGEVLVVVMSAGFVCRVGVRSASLVVVSS